MFENAKLKHSWAHEHIKNLQTAIGRFIQSNRHDISIKTDHDTGDISIAVSFSKPIPPMIALIIGDVIRNLKTALDYATWELIGLDGGGQHPQVYFPSGDTKRNYEATCNGIITPRADTREFFIGLRNHGEPNSGNIFLRGLHLLDRSEKHTIITPLAGATRIPHMKVINPDGVIIGESKNCSFLMEADGRTHIKVGRGNTVQLNQQANTTIEIFLAKFPPLPGPQPAIHMIMFMANAVHDTLVKFEQFVTTRPQ
jgi:hypothetical protein